MTLFHGHVCKKKKKKIFVHVLQHFMVDTCIEKIVHNMLHVPCVFKEHN